MKLYFLKQDALDTLRGNLETNAKKYMNQTNDWIIDFFDRESPFVEYKKEVDEFTLDMSSDKPNTTDLENVKRIYTAMKTLSETDASDERLWAGLAHGQLWEFMRYRWQYDKEIPIARNIETRYMFGYGIRASNYRNTLSKLWWVGRLTYDETRKNHFELTEVLKRDFTTRVNDLLYSNMYSANPMICRSFLSAIKFHEDRGASVNGDIFRKATQYLNVLGGTYILDYFDEDALKEKIINEIYRLLGEKQIVSNNNNVEKGKETSEVLNGDANFTVSTIKNNNVVQIKMSQIIVDKHKFHIEPHIGKVNALIEYYQKHKTLDKPIIVIENEDKYLLHDKYLRYYVAKKLGLSTIDAIVQFNKIVS
ncbi:DUF6339 family protein [Hathewaya limosa]|uniref:Uncharacterized protein n=1 Tax=Hathewaya limosa TaxID=1536 RepID=A0ABU0JS32_HATLI|nr:DUF6339 family protein [Hathewaya limosa]MDQ0479913.1 hypothetical protein [Hathewaya limosa]